MIVATSLPPWSDPCVLPDPPRFSRVCPERDFDRELLGVLARIFHPLLSRLRRSVLYSGV
jgi:hypothetical protein